MASAAAAASHTACDLPAILPAPHASWRRYLLSCSCCSLLSSLICAEGGGASPTRDGQRGSTHSTPAGALRNSHDGSHDGTATGPGPLCLATQWPLWHQRPHRDVRPRPLDTANHSGIPPWRSPPASRHRQPQRHPTVTFPSGLQTPPTTAAPHRDVHQRAA